MCTSGPWRVVVGKDADQVRSTIAYGVANGRQFHTEEAGTLFHREYHSFLAPIVIRRTLAGNEGQLSGA